MKKHIYQGIKLLRTEEAIPVCGDTCNRCGNCLKCDGEDECLDGGEHYWVVYADKNEELKDDEKEDKKDKRKKDSGKADDKAGR